MVKGFCIVYIKNKLSFFATE